MASSEAPRSLVADATLSSEDSAVPLAQRGFLTRIPATLKRVSQVISQALQGALWHDVDEGTRSQPIALCHYGMAQRWLVVCSPAACERAEKSVNHAQQRAGEAIKKPRFHLQAKRFETPDTAPAALAAVRQSWRSHQVDTHHLLEHKRSESKGRPSAETPLTSIAWQMQAQVRPDQAVIEAHKHHHACSVIGTNIDASQLSAVEILAAYKSQSHAEGGCRFLKDPLLFVSSLLVKKPSRIQGLLMVMT